MPVVRYSHHETILILVFLLAISTLSFSGKLGETKRWQQTSGLERRPQYLSDEVVIKFKATTRLKLGKSAVGVPTTGILSVDNVLQKLQGEKLKPIFPHHKRSTASNGVDLSRFYSLRYRNGTDPKKAAKVLESTGVIEYAEPRYIRYPLHTPNDPDFARQWYLRKIQSDRAWDVTRGDTNVVIGIVDTGVDWQHPDLLANIWQNRGEIPNNGLDDDRNGFVDDIRGWDFGGLDGTPDNNPDEDRPDHGTGLAGVASAVTDNGIGIAGVGFRCKIMPVKTSRDDLRDGFGNALIVYGYEGLVYAADNGASVINASWGSTGYSRLGQEVINYVVSKGALVVAAAGNKASAEIFYPAGYRHVLAVAAVDSFDIRSSYSNYGFHVGVSAPGDAIYSTWKQPQYVLLSGTSVSTAIVSGVAALVKTVHRHWTPDQILQQIRVTADPIDNLNFGFFSRQLGFGRVNAFRAVSDSSSPAVQMITYTISDSIGGNNDRLIDPGEEIRIVGEFRNFLHPTSNATAQLTSSDPFITITRGTFALGSMRTLQTITNATNPFVFRVLPTVPENYQATLHVEFYDGTYRDYTGFTVLINATYKDHDINNIRMTITSKGALAFNDYPNNQQGTGFIFRPAGSENLLFEGAFMAGTDAAHVVDVARSENEQFQSTDFISERRFSLIPSPVISNQEGFGVFTDAGAGANRIGLRIKLNTYAFKDVPDNDYVILKYTLLNRTSSPISNLHAGLYLDWDVPEGYYGQNVARYDSVRRMGYVFDSRNVALQAHAGAVLLTPGRIHFRAIDNNHETPGNPWGVYDGFTKSEKWQALSGGTTRIQEGPADVSMFIGTGPLSLAVGDSSIIGFALVGATNLSNLQAAAGAARQKWNRIITSVEKIASEIPSTFFLHQNYPNPFNPTTTIRYDLPHETSVTLKLFNLLGQEVRTLVDEVQDAGFKFVTIDARGLSSGVYFYKLRAGAYVETRKMIILR